MPGPFANDEQCQDFVKNLKKMRDLFGWSQDRLASESHCTVVAMIESFKRSPLEEHGKAFDDAFGLTDVFAAKARTIQGGSFPAAFESFPRYEAEADDLYIYEHSLFPGLVQTVAYQRAVFWTLPNITDDEVERLVAARLSRQEAVFGQGSKRPRVWALIDEGALRRPSASDAVMFEQCMHALEVSRLPHVSLAVVPFSAGGHIGLSGACTIVEREGQARTVNTDDLADGRVSEEPAIVRRVALRFSSLQHEALPGGASRDMIARVAEEVWNRKAPTGARALSARPTEDSA
jgi:hypothetical protein